MTVATEPTLEDIQVAIKTCLDTVSDLRAAAEEPANPAFPAAYPRLVDWTYDDTFDGTTTWHFDVWVLVGVGPGFPGGQKWLNRYLAPAGPDSIKEAFDRDPSLGGVVASARATGGGQYGQVETAGYKALAASIRIEVLT